MDTLLQDLRYAVRQLVRNRGFTIVAVLTLTLGIGANTAIFSVIRGVLLRPLPFPEPKRLMLGVETIGQVRSGVSAPDFNDWRAQSRTLDLGAFATYNANLTGVDEPERVTAARVTSNYFSTLGVRPVLGRVFAPDEEPQGGPHVAVLAQGFWRRRLAGDSIAIGRSITLDDVPYTIVGVMGPDAEGLENGEDVWVPLAITRKELTQTGSRFLTPVARLRPGVEHAQASAELQGIAARIAQVRPWSNKDAGAALIPMSEVVVGDSRQSLLLLFGAVGLVLLIACANVANLLLVRATARVRESAIRTALGAGPARIIRQLLTESVLLSLIGAVGGLVLAAWGTGLLVQALPAGTPRLDQVRLDGVVLAFTLAIAMLTGIVFGLAPALRAARPDLVQGLTDAARGSGGLQRRRLGAALVVAEIAVALVLLVSAGLLLRSFAALSRVDPGFDAERLTALRIALPESRYGQPAQTVLFYEGLLARAHQIPGVRESAVASSVPFGSGGYNLSIVIEGRDAPVRAEDTPMIFPRAISAGYFRTIGIRLVQGREFDAGDRTGALRVAILNETAVRRYFPGQDPIGHRITPDDNGVGPMQIVGVVSDVRGFGLASEPRPELFYPIQQAASNHWEWTGRAMSLIVRADAGVRAAPLSVGLREAVWSLDRSLPIYSIWDVRTLISRSVAPRRLFMLLIAGFASVALLLAAIGIYGVMTFTVSQRTREMGIRVALGAVRQDVFRLVVGRAMVLTGLGLAVGVLAAVAVTRLLTQSLYGIRPSDPLTYLAIAALMCAVAFVASYLPARRAARVDPMVALRHD
jgi:putative ABC transport system permease protein